MSKKNKKESTKGESFEDIPGSKPLSSDERYLKAEFTAMDTNKNGKLSTGEFLKLLAFLGYADQNGAKKLLEKVNKDHDDDITIDEYYDGMKNNPNVMKGTSRLRDLFHEFDLNLDGSAFKEDIYKGYERFGFKLDKELKSAIDKLDLNNDGKVQYVDFVRAELKHKKIIS